MKIIGITGGIGAGKTEVLAYIRGKYNCEVLLADEVAHQVQEPGGGCYEALVALLGQEVLAADGKIDRKKMAEKMFGNEVVLQQVNALVHPLVREYILEEIKRAGREGKMDFLFIEAALLIEGGYADIVDELWYIYAGEEVRRQRLKHFRNYSDEKISGILGQQLSEEEFRKHCKVVVDNGGSLSDTYEQIDKKLEGYL